MTLLRLFPRIPTVLAALVVISPLSRAEAAKPKPNVVFILADDLGYGDPSCHGRGKIATPAIDKLAAEGLRMTDGYSPASTCTPTRYSILTGESSWRQKGTGILKGDAPLIISPSRLTLPKIFRDAGYVTGAFGKWHLGLGLGDEKNRVDFNKKISPGPTELGFDHTFNMAATGDRTPCVYVKDGHVVNLDPTDPIMVDYEKPIPDSTFAEYRSNPELIRMHSSVGHNFSLINGIGRIGYVTGGKKAVWDDQTLSDTFNENALRFIRENKTKPFFLYYAAHEPHVPRDPNPRFVGKSGVGVRGDAILQLDDQVRRIMETLREAGVDDNTLVIFSSDNGPAVEDGYRDFAEENEGKAGHDASGGLRDGKFTPFEGGLRVPFIARWLGHIKPGVSSEPVSLIDMCALAAAITDTTLKPADAPDSFNILPVFTAGAKSPHTFLTFGNSAAATGPAPEAIRKGKWKLVVRGAGKNGGLLFDLCADRAEKNDLAKQHPETVADLRAELDRTVAAGFSRPGAQKIDKR